MATTYSYEQVKFLIKEKIDNYLADGMPLVDAAINGVVSFYKQILASEENKELFLKEWIPEYVEVSRKELAEFFQPVYDKHIVNRCATTFLEQSCHCSVDKQVALFIREIPNHVYAHLNKRTVH